MYNILLYLEELEKQEQTKFIVTTRMKIINLRVEISAD